MFERLRNKIDICLDHPGENEIILVLEKYFLRKKKSKKLTPGTNHPKDDLAPRMIEPPVRMIILIILALVQA